MLELLVIISLTAFGDVEYQLNIQVSLHAIGESQLRDCEEIDPSVSLWEASRLAVDDRLQQLNILTCRSTVL